MRKVKFKSTIEIESAGCFDNPDLHILKEDAEKDLIELIKNNGAGETSVKIVSSDIGEVEEL
jgi:hypothetical protein